MIENRFIDQGIINTKPFNINVGISMMKLRTYVGISIMKLKKFHKMLGNCSTHSGWGIAPMISDIPLFVLETRNTQWL